MFIVINNLNVKKSVSRRDLKRITFVVVFASLQTYLEELVSLWPDFTSRGDNGKLLMSRYYSIPRGLNHTKARIQHEIEVWQNVYNKRYVLLVEADTHANLTLHTRSEDGTYSRRACSAREVILTPPNILPHLYGQLVQTTQVRIVLIKSKNIQFYFGCTINETLFELPLKSGIGKPIKIRAANAFSGNIDPGQMHQ